MAVIYTTAHCVSCWVLLNVVMGFSCFTFVIDVTIFREYFEFPQGFCLPLHVILFCPMLGDSWFILFIWLCLSGCFFLLDVYHAKLVGDCIACDWLCMWRMNKGSWIISPFGYGNWLWNWCYIIIFPSMLLIFCLLPPNTRSFGINGFIKAELSSFSFPSCEWIVFIFIWGLAASLNVRALYMYVCVQGENIPTLIVLCDYIFQPVTRLIK